MKVQDARKLSAQAEEALRYRVVNAVNNGMGQTEAEAGVCRLSHLSVQMDKN